MSDTPQTNALAEIAFALAMGFFSLMVLTMVSMGGTKASPSAPKEIALEETPLILGQTTPTPDNSATHVSQEALVIFSRGQYLTATLTPFSPAQAPPDTALILAVSPALSMAETLDARRPLAHHDVTVVPLTKAWLATLQEAGL